MSKFTLLETNQAIGDKKLDIFTSLKEEYLNCDITDFSILLGAYISDIGKTYYAFKDKSDISRSMGYRPAIPYSAIKSFTSNEHINEFGVKEVIYGEFPQMIASKYITKKLEEKFIEGKDIRKTGRVFTTDAAKYNEYSKSFEPKLNEEYEYNGKKYIRYVGDENCGKKLSDGRKVVFGEPYWVCVEPITWLIDEKANIALSKKILFSGIQYSNVQDYHGDFKDTDIKKYMDNYFSKEIIIANNIKINLDSIDLTLLSEEQLFGDNQLKKQLDIFKKYDVKAIPTDLSKILGCYYLNDAGWYCTKTLYGDKNFYVAYNKDDNCIGSVNKRDAGIRPVIPYSLIKPFSKNEVLDNNGIKTVTCGEYPQIAVEKNMQSMLNQLYDSKKLKKTGNTYTFDSRKYNETSSGFSLINYDEYIYNDKKYIRVKVSSCYDGRYIFFQDGMICKDGNYIWIQVMPVEWLIDEKSNLAISKYIIAAGIRYDSPKTCDNIFEHTEMKKYLDNYMKNDLFRNVTLVNEEDIDLIKTTKKQNPYNFSFDEVSEEDIIKGAVESNISVFLHGRSSEGKSARVKELDPDCEIVYMRNATPDSLNGKSVYNASTGEMIDVPPTWYKKVCDKCEAEPNKIHIIFFDELTNALPSIQGMAFNIILDKEVNGKWKLPSNARIVAAGNDLNDSLAANQMAEPLFNRFAHVYIETTVDSWLKWASSNDKYERLDYKENKYELKIHPAIYAYIAYKSYSNEDVLRTPYKGDKPNADPRKWEMASRVLYKTRKPEMLRALIGEDLTRDFVAFTKTKVITIEDVINHNYNDTDLEMNVSEKFAVAAGLSSVDEEHFKIVREFMEKLGNEAKAVFESMWAHGDENRLEHIALIDLEKGDKIKCIKKD